MSSGNEILTTVRGLVGSQAKTIGKKKWTRKQQVKSKMRPK